MRKMKQVENYTFPFDASIRMELQTLLLWSRNEKVKLLYKPFLLLPTFIYWIQTEKTFHSLLCFYAIIIKMACAGSVIGFIAILAT